MKKISPALILAPVLIAMLFFCTRAAADVTAKVNIALDDGTIMIYAGSNQGLNIGDELEVTRSGNRVGMLKVQKLKELFSYCTLIDGEAKEMDTVTRIKTAAPGSIDEKPAPRTRMIEEPKEDNEPPKEESSASRSRRRDDAANKPPDEEPPTNPKTSDRRTTPPPKEEKSSKKEKSSGKKELPKADKSARAPLGYNGTAAFGGSGLIFMPSGNSRRSGSLGASLLYVNAGDKTLEYTDTGIGITYGLGTDIEVSYMYVNSEDNSYYYATSTGDTSTSANIIGFKFQLPSVQPPSFLKKQMPSMRYAAGIQYYNYSEGDNATRFYAVATGGIWKGVGHFGIYQQSGEVLDETSDKGVGLFGGFDYPLLRGKEADINQMSVMLEGDTKAFYLGTHRTLSLGLRYAFADRGEASLSIADLARTNTMVLKGAYNF